MMLMNFLNVGDVSPSQTFTINVQGCPTAKSTVYSSGVSANVRFTGDADAINSALLRLSAGADSATGLGIEILDNNDVAIAINGESGFRDLVLNENGDANLTFKLRYKSTQGKCTCRASKCSVVFLISIISEGDMKIFISLFFVYNINKFFC